MNKSNKKTTHDNPELACLFFFPPVIIGCGNGLKMNSNDLRTGNQGIRIFGIDISFQRSISSRASAACA